MPPANRLFVPPTEEIRDGKARLLARLPQLQGEPALADDTNPTDPTELAGPGDTGVGREPGGADDDPRYEFGEVFARGGLGVVRRGHDHRLGRPVAIKELLRDSPTAARRFALEAAITARLQHPGIVPLYDLGWYGPGKPYYCMKLVDGESLEAKIAGCPDLPARLRLLEHVVAVADAIAYAHDQEIIHRDIKPANVLVGKFGETVVIDWGLAKDLSGRVLETLETPEDDGDDDGLARLRSDMTEAGTVMGTLRYMPPEQARGETVDARSDVYSLGALLYHVLAGEPPFVDTDRDALVNAVLTGSRAPLRALDPAIPSGLIAIATRAQALSPEDRYASAADFAEDLRRFQAGRLVEAHQYSLGELARRWVRRHRFVLGVSTVALAIVGGVGVNAALEVRAQQRRAAASEAASQAQVRAVEERTQAALRESYLGSLNRGGYVELQTLDDPLRALPLLNEVYRERPDDLHLRELIAIAARPADAFAWRVGGHSLGVEALAVSRDGALAASADGHDVRVWDAVSGQPITTIDGVDKRIGDLKFSPDGQRLVASSFAGEVWSWAPRTGELRSHAPGTEETWYSFPISPDTTWFARNVVGSHGIEIVDVARGEVVRALPETDASALDWSADSRTLAVDASKGYELWEVATGTLLSRHAFEGDHVYGGMSRGGNGKLLADGHARFVQVSKGRVYVRDTSGVELVLEGDIADPFDRDSDYQFVLDPGGAWIVIAGPDGHVDLWELPSGKRRFRVKHGCMAFNGIRLSADGARVATASVEGVVRIMDVKNGTLLARFDGHDGGASTVAFTPRGDGLISGSQGGSVYRWRADAQGLTTRLDGALLATRDDAGAVVTREASGVVSVRTLRDDAEPVELPGAAGAVAASFSRDGERLAVAVKRDDELVLELRSATSGALQGEVPLAMESVSRALPWSEDGRLVVASSRRGSSDLVVVDVEKQAVAKRIMVGFPIGARVVHASGRLVLDEMTFAPPQFVQHIWNTRTWEQIAARPGSSRGAVSWDNHAQTVTAHTGQGGAPELLDLETGQVLHALRDEANPLPEVALGHRYEFSHDDALVGSAHVDGTIRLWSTASGALHATLRGHGSNVRRFSMDPAGPRLVSCSSDGTAIVWNSETGARSVTLDPASVALNEVQFTPDGAHVVASGVDASTHVWHIETGRLITRVAGVAQLGDNALARPGGSLLTWDSAREVGYVWDLAPEQRSAEQLDALIAARVPWVLERGELRPR
ncbi:MAG: protein kinase [Myxococcales bacterium]|nr:protein kinase [Myxococcales bacterium]